MIPKPALAGPTPECPNRLTLAVGTAGVEKATDQSAGADEARSSEAREWSLVAAGDGRPGSDALERWLHSQPSSGAGQGTSLASVAILRGRFAAAARDQIIGTLRTT